MEWYGLFWKRYFDFSGRSRRVEYWLATILNLAIMGALAVATVAAQNNAFLGLFALFIMATIVPNLSVTVRRLHDIGLSGLWILLTFVPILGPVAIFVMTLLPSEFGDNPYGPDPRDAEEEWEE